MKYSIGEFAEILGVTADTLRLYEKHGIIRPIKDKKNNYRYFDDLDARNLLQSRWYRSLQIPLQDVAFLIKEASLDSIAEKINETQSNLEEEIRKSQMLLSRVIQINNDIKEIEASLNRCKVKKLPGIYRLKQTNRNILLQDYSLRGTVNEWMNILPYAFYSFRIENKEFSSEENLFEYSWGLAVYEEEVQRLNIKINEDIEYIRPKTYISSVILSSDGEYIMRDSLQFMLDYVSENGYSVAGDIIGRIILTEKAEGRSRTYLEVNIPV